MGQMLEIYMGQAFLCKAPDLQGTLASPILLIRTCELASLQSIFSEFVCRIVKNLNFWQMLLKKVVTLVFQVEVFLLTKVLSSQCHITQTD